MAHEPALYLYLQRKLLDKCDSNNQLHVKSAEWGMITLRIPKQLFPVLLKEMERLNLTKKVNRYKIEVVNCKACDKLNHLNKLYHEVGLW